MEKLSLNNINIQKKTIWRCVVSWSLLFYLIYVLHNFGFLQFLEFAAYDLLVSTFTRASAWKPPITIINIDEADIQRLGTWPLTDDQMVEALNIILAASPRVVGVDIYRDLPVCQGTHRLNDLFRQQPKIIVIEKFPSKFGNRIRPPLVLENTNRVGFADVSIDAGGIARRNLMFQTTKTTGPSNNGYRVGYSFALRLALAYLAENKIYAKAGIPNPRWLRLGTTTIMPLDGHAVAYVDNNSGGYEILLEYIGGASPFPHFTLSDLLDKKFDPALLRDRIVILGADSEGVKDRFTTPHAILGGPQISGSVIHAHATRQFLEIALHDRPPIAVLGHNMELLWLLIWIIPGLIIGWVDVSPIILALSMVGGGIVIIGGYISAFSMGWWIPLIPPLLGWYGALTVSTILRYGAMRSERQAIMGLFERHVSPKIAKTIWDNRDTLSKDGLICAQELTVTTLFSDLQGFTKISEAMAPTDFFMWLNRYLGKMTEIVMQYDGILDDYAGDGIKANFGVPLARTHPEQISQDARQAVDCALALRETLNQLNHQCKIEGLPNVGMRIGIHSGRVVAGTVGSRSRMKYTTVGSAVNIASRLENMKEVPIPSLDSASTSCRILISAATADLLGGKYHITRQGCFELKGIQHDVEVFSVA